MTGVQTCALPIWLNIGKIGLTNAELVKAILLNSSNFNKDRGDTLRLRQQEISSEWDRIEYTLQKENFWLFLNETCYENPTRIDFIFELMCERNILGLEEDELRYIGTDKDKSFRYFYQYFSRENASINYCWEQVKALFNTFVEWYDDLQLYHYVGFLIVCRPTELTKLVGLWGQSEDKSHFLQSLKKEIKVEIFRPLPKEYVFNSEVKAKTACKPMLLFHNIQTVINRNAKGQNDQIGQEGTT